MSGLDRTALASNALVVLSWAVAYVDGGFNAAYIAVAVTLCALIVSSIAVTQKDRRPRAFSREPAAPLNASDTLDARTVLDLDARLEALEKAQHDAVDAARWRALVESGQVTAPASETPASAASGSGPALRNGR